MDLLKFFPHQTFKIEPVSSRNRKQKIFSFSVSETKNYSHQPYFSKGFCNVNGGNCPEMNLIVLDFLRCEAFKRVRTPQNIFWMSPTGQYFDKSTMHSYNQFISDRIIDDCNFFTLHFDILGIPFEPFKSSLPLLAVVKVLSEDKEYVEFPKLFTCKTVLF